MIELDKLIKSEFPELHFQPWNLSSLNWLNNKSKLID